LPTPKIEPETCLCSASADGYSMRWIDTHCHLDAAEFDPDRLAVRAKAAMNGVAHCVLPAVSVANFDVVREWAHAQGDSYALGIHPLYVGQAHDDDLARLDAQLHQHRDDPRLVAVGEIGLDYFVPTLAISPLRERQEHFYVAQLKLARQHDLPVILHVRRSADRLLKGLRSVAGPAGGYAWRGIAHAFNGSEQQAHAFIALGFKLGFGGALTFDRALQLRRLAARLPLEAIVLETDAPDMPPHWLYTTAEQRATGVAQGRNEPGELPRMGAELAALRGMSLADLAAVTTHNAMEALPRLKALPWS
jgi:TatD DNase family protein